MEAPNDLTVDPGLGVCDRCERIKPLGWFGFFWLCDECTLVAVDHIGVDALGRCVERISSFVKEAAHARSAA